MKGEAEFSWRGGDPSRVEALTDMVFAFALTLLVVSSAPPGSFAELQRQLWGFPGFAAAFAILLLLWHSHYIFFRRYALEDGWTTALNAALLFIILFFVYPLKYLATMLSLWIASVAAGDASAPMSFAEARAALIIMSGGYALVFAMFALLYAHALGKASQLELNAREVQLTRFGLWAQLVHVCVGGAVVLAAALLPLAWAPLAGFIYFLIGPLMFTAGVVLAPTPKAQPRPSM
ncbi:MAG: TMEM175 family protein [Hyphomonadaceae bacterium]